MRISSHWNQDVSGAAPRPEVLPRRAGEGKTLMLAASSIAAIIEHRRTSTRRATTGPPARKLPPHDLQKSRSRRAIRLVERRPDRAADRASTRISELPQRPSKKPADTGHKLNFSGGKEGARNACGKSAACRQNYC